MNVTAEPDEQADRRDARPLGGGGAPAGDRRAAGRPRGALDLDRVPVPAGSSSARATPSTRASPCRCAARPDRSGFLTVFSRSPSRSFGDPELEELEELAARAGPAIENARRFREARQLADLDALTGLHNRRYFHETLEREVARAQRYGRKLALIVFDLDDFKAINDRIGHLAGDAVLAEAAERVRGVVRSADIACRVGGDEFAVDPPGVGARRRRPALPAGPRGGLGAARSARPAASSCPPASPSSSEDDDPTRFFERADEALYRAKEAGKGQVRPRRRASARAERRLDALGELPLGR